MELKTHTRFRRLIFITEREDLKELFRFKIEKKEFKNNEKYHSPLAELADLLNNIIYRELDSTDGKFQFYRADMSYLSLKNEEADFIENLNWSKPTKDKRGGYIRFLINRKKESDLFIKSVNKFAQKFDKKSNLRFSLLNGFLSADFLIDGRNLEQHFNESESDEHSRSSKLDSLYRAYLEIFNDDGIEKLRCLKHELFCMYIFMNKVDLILENGKVSVENLVENFHPNISQIEESAFEVIKKLTDRDWGSERNQYIDLEGRVDDLVLSLKGSKVVTIVGEGGLGKTELVYQSLKQIVYDTDNDLIFSRVYPFTFKGNIQQEFCERLGRKSVQHKGWIPQSEFSQVLTFLAEKSKKWTDKTDIEQRLDCAVNFLVEGSFCIVIDNTEVIEEGEFQEDLENFINSFLMNCRNDTKSRIIITTRVRNAQRKGQQISMKFLNSDEMKNLAIARANWLYRKESDKTPDINISNDYSLWDSFSKLINSELGIKNAHVIGHPLFVFVGVYASMFDNNTKLPFHAVIQNLVENMTNSSSSSLGNLFDYITSISINYIKEIDDWNTILFRMVSFDIFSIDDIINWSHEDSLDINAIDVVNRLEALQIIKPSSDEDIMNYEFKTEYHRKNLKSKLLENYDFQEKEMINQKKLDEFKLLVERISEPEMYTRYVDYISLESRIEFIKNRKISNLNKEWIVVLKGLINRSVEAIEKIKSGIIFLKNEDIKTRLEFSLTKYIEYTIHKIMEYFVHRPNKNLLLYLSELQRELIDIDAKSYEKEILAIVTCCAGKLDFLYNKDTFIAAERLFSTLQSLQDFIDIELEFKLYNIMIGSHGQDIDNTIFATVLNKSGVQNYREHIQTNSDKICRALAKTPTVLLNKSNTVHPIFQDLDKETDLRLASRFDSFIVECPGLNAKDNVSNFTFQNDKFIVYNSPLNVKAGQVKLNLFWIGQDINSEGSIYYTIFNDEVTKILPPMPEKGKPQNFTKEQMHDLVFGCFSSRIKIQKLLAKIITIIETEELGFTWGEWKKHWFSRNTKMVKLFKELSKGEWTIKGKESDAYLEKRMVDINSLTQLLNNTNSSYSSKNRGKKHKKKKRGNTAKAAEFSRKSREK